MSRDHDRWLQSLTASSTISTNTGGFNHGVVSPAATDLEKEGYIVLSADQREGKYVYQITPTGRERLRELIHTGFETDEISGFSNRRDVLIRLGFLHHLPEVDQAVVLNTIEGRLAIEREQWVEIQQMHECERSDDAQTGYRQDLIQLNITMLDALLQWVKGLNIRTLDVGTDAVSS